MWITSEYLWKVVHYLWKVECKNTKISAVEN